MMEMEPKGEKDTRKQGIRNIGQPTAQTRPTGTLPSMHRQKSGRPYELTADQVVPHLAGNYYGRSTRSPAANH